MSVQGDFGDLGFSDVWQCNCHKDLFNSASKPTTSLIFLGLCRLCISHSIKKSFNTYMGAKWRHFIHGISVCFDMNFDVYCASFICSAAKVMQNGLTHCQSGRLQLLQQRKVTSVEGTVGSKGICQKKFRSTSHTRGQNTFVD